MTEAPGNTLPEGTSPDNQEMEFTPGAVYSRRGLAKVFDTPFPSGGPSSLVPTITYAKSYVDPLGIIRNLYLDSNGSLWVENINASPGTKSSLATTTPGTYAKSITAFGREYIAISDGLHGQEIPLQYDGTNLDRVTQDGPGGPPEVNNYAYGAVLMAPTGAPSTLTIVECDPQGVGPGGTFTAIAVYVTAIGDCVPGSTITISGSVSPYNGTWTVTNVFPETVGTDGLLWIGGISLPSGTVFHLGGTVTISSGVTMSRGANVVTVTTATPHNLKIGYQAQITGVPAGIVGGTIASVVINNEDNPGIATVSTATAHGLVPGSFVSLKGIVATTTAISAVSRQGKVVTVVTSAAHNLFQGASITVASVTIGTFNTSTFVAQIVDSVTFTYLQDDADITSTGGTVANNWPIPETPTPRLFEVISAPTATSIQVGISYSDGTWGAGGTVSYAWDGTFFVLAIPDNETFQYQQYGPNDSTSSTAGTVSLRGQISPGKHQCQVMFLTRQGAITAPSPPLTFVANGGQYLSVTNIPIGPSNVVARILAFTGGQGAYFFYIPATPQINGQVVGTATQINDNTSTSAILDFSDNTLFAGLGISTPGNNLANQIVLEGALGWGFYGSRLISWGQRNRIQNFLNLGFDGGYYPTDPTIPCGWLTASAGGALANGHFGKAWKISTAGSGNWGILYQPAFEDAYGAPILTANTRYKIRVWLKLSGAASDVVFDVWLNSPSTAFTAIATVSGPAISTSGAWCEANFDVATPATIPADMQLEIFASAITSTVDVTVDELSIIYRDNPYLDTILYGSYVNNPEAFDGLSGKLGSTQDNRKVMDLGIIRNTLYFLTLEPSGRIHQTSDNGVTEPAGWNVAQVAQNCGLISAFAMAKSQADDSSTGGGEEWFAWMSGSGPRIFSGDHPYEIGEELQPNWTGDPKRGISGLNWPGQLTAWALNDPKNKLLLFGVPTLDSLKFLGLTAPNMVYALSYRKLDTAAQIAGANPVHTNLAGRLNSTDHTRKWTRWNLPINGGAMMYRTTASNLSTVMLGGNAFYPGVAAGYGNVYTLETTKLTDDDYGQLYPWYVTYFAPTSDQEESMQFGGGRKQLSYLSAFIDANPYLSIGCILTVTFLCDTALNPWAVTVSRTLPPNAIFDMECAGGGALGQRIAVKFASSPRMGQTDNAMNLSRVTMWMKPAARMPVRGSAA